MEFPFFPQFNSRPPFSIATTMSMGPEEEWSSFTRRAQYGRLTS